MIGHKIVIVVLVSYVAFSKDKKTSKRNTCQEIIEDQEANKKTSPLIGVESGLITIILRQIISRSQVDLVPFFAGQSDFCCFPCLKDMLGISRSDDSLHLPWIAEDPG